MPSVYQTRCSSVHRFHFEWDSGDINRSLPLAEAYLRLYVQLIDRHIPVGSGVPVNISMHLGLSNGRSVEDSSTSSSVDETSLSFLTDITTDSDGWLEINVTQELLKIWDKVENNKIIDVTLRFSVNCGKQKRILKVINPATLDHTPKRERQLALQPLFVVYIDDANIKNLREKHIAVNESGLNLTKVGKEELARSKRDMQPSICHMEDFTVNFTTLNIPGVFQPEIVNIRQCVGGCSLYHLQIAAANLSTNHAKIMAGAHAHRKDKSTNYLPCCSPTAYSDNYIIFGIGQNLTTIEIRMFPNLVVEQCACV